MAFPSLHPETWLLNRHVELPSSTPSPLGRVFNKTSVFREKRCCAPTPPPRSLGCSTGGAGSQMCCKNQMPTEMHPQCMPLLRNPRAHGAPRRTSFRQPDIVSTREAVQTLASVGGLPACHAACCQRERSSAPGGCISLWFSLYRPRLQTG